MSGAQISTCGRVEALAEVLRNTRSESTVVVVACLTNFLTSSEETSSSVGLRVGPVLRSFREIVLDFCQEQPERLVFYSFMLFGLDQKCPDLHYLFSLRISSLSCSYSDLFFGFFLNVFTLDEFLSDVA